MKSQESAARRAKPSGIHVAPTLLIVGPVEEGCGQDAMFSQFPWPAHRLSNCLDVALHLSSSHPCVVICERDLGDCDWKHIVEVTASLPDPPPVIVTSRLADERLWAEVLNFGGFDVLAKPLDAHEVRRVVSFAWEHWVDRAFPPQRIQAPLMRRENVRCSAA